MYVRTRIYGSREFRRLALTTGNRFTRLTHALFGMQRRESSTRRNSKRRYRSNKLIVENKNSENIQSIRSMSIYKMVSDKSMRTDAVVANLLVKFLDALVKVVKQFAASEM